MTWKFFSAAVFLISLDAISAPTQKGPYSVDIDDTARTIRIEIPVGSKKERGHHGCADEFQGPIITRLELDSVPIRYLTHEELAVQINRLCSNSLGILERGMPDDDEVNSLLGRWASLQKEGIRELRSTELQQRYRFEEKAGNTFLILTLFY